MIFQCFERVSGIIMNFSFSRSRSDSNPIVERYENMEQILHKEPTQNLCRQYQG